MPGGAAEVAGRSYSALVEDCWELDPLQRPAAHEVALRLRGILHEHTGMAAAMAPGGASARGASPAGSMSSISL